MFSNEIVSNVGYNLVIDFMPIDHIEISLVDMLPFDLMAIESVLKHVI